MKSFLYSVAHFIPKDVIKLNAFLLFINCQIIMKKGVVSMNLNDTIFMFLCTLLVWLMTPGLSLFYGGLVQSKNALNTVMQSMAAIVLVTFVWITVGFTISFGNGNLWFGNWEYTFLNHVGFATQEDISPHIPFALFMLFQMMFCTIAISILSGSIAEKMKFIPYLLFVVIWTALVYSPVAHWVWAAVGLTNWCIRFRWRYGCSYYIRCFWFSISYYDWKRKQTF